MYKDYVFQWRNEHNNNCRFLIRTDDKSYAWHRALLQCGWEQRCTIGLVGNNPALGIRDGVVMNWWELMKEMHRDKELKKFKLSISFNLGDRLASGFYKITSV